MSLQDQPLNLLKIKCQLLQTIIDESKDDPRVDEPIRQLNIIEAEIKSRKENKNLVVGLKTLTLKGTTK